MRDKIKQILVDWNLGKGLPDSCKLVGFSGGFIITNEEDDWVNWEVSGTSCRYDKVWYKIYNKYSPKQESEKGIIIIGTYNV